METLIRLQKQKRLNNLERIAFGFMLGAVFTTLIYYIAIHSGHVEIIYK